MNGRPTLLVIVLAVAAAGFWVGARVMRSESPDLATAEPVPRLVVADADLHFGEPWAQRGFQWTLPVRNVSAFDVEVLEWEPSCGACTNVAPPSLVVAAGETRDVTVTLDLTKRRAVEGDAASYPFAVALRPIVKLREGGGRRAGGPSGVAAERRGAQLCDGRSAGRAARGAVDSGGAVSGADGATHVFADG